MYKWLLMKFVQCKTETHIAFASPDETTVCVLEGSKDGFLRVSLKCLVSDHVDMELCGCVDSSIHPSMAIQHCQE